MENFVVTLEFLGALACFFAIGHLIGLILRVDQYYTNIPKINRVF